MPVKKFAAPIFKHASNKGFLGGQIPLEVVVGDIMLNAIVELTRLLQKMYPRIKLSWEFLPGL